MNNIYAGIGARNTPYEVLKQMELYGEYFAKKDILLRSGGAEGADSAFQKGCEKALGDKIIYQAKHYTKDSLYMASKYHPNWDKCSNYVRKLHARNCLIMLGGFLQQPVDFVMCWTPKGAVTGGTGQALRIALDYNIPIINLYKP